MNNYDFCSHRDYIGGDPLVCRELLNDDAWIASRDCLGCGWDRWIAANPTAPHRHREEYDGARLGCCAHTCDRSYLDLARAIVMPEAHVEAAARTAAYAFVEAEDVASE